MKSVNGKKRNHSLRILEVVEKIGHFHNFSCENHHPPPIPCKALLILRTKLTLLES